MFEHNVNDMIVNTEDHEAERGNEKVRDEIIGGTFRYLCNDRQICLQHKPKTS